MTGILDTDGFHARNAAKSLLFKDPEFVKRYNATKARQGKIFGATRRFPGNKHVVTVVKTIAGRDKGALPDFTAGE